MMDAGTGASVKRAGGSDGGVNAPASTATKICNRVVCSGSSVTPARTVRAPGTPRSTAEPPRSRE